MESKSPYDIKTAKAEDAPRVIDILHGAAHWLNSTGKPMWQLDELDPIQIEKDVVAGQFYLAYFDGEPVGTFKLIWQDLEYWPEYDDSSAGYVHRLAIKRELAGLGLSQCMLHFAANECSNNNKNYLRLDCAKLIKKLQRFYESTGFQFHSYFDHGDYEVARYFYTVSK